MSRTLPASPVQDQNLYAIVDCAHLDGIFYLETVEAPYTVCKSLFTDTPYVENAMAGPLLCKIEPRRNTLAEKLLDIEQETPQAILWLWSRNEFPDLFVTLQRLVFGEQRNGKQIVLRYYDPRLLERMLKMFRMNAASRRLLDGISAWAFLQDGQYQYLGGA
jgi:hypothetical protein